MHVSLIQYKNNDNMSANISANCQYLRLAIANSSKTREQKHRRYNAEVVLKEEGG